MQSFASGLCILSIALLLGSCLPLSTEPATKETPKSIALPQSEQGEISSLSFEQFFILHESNKDFLIDARHGYFYQLGHIPRAIHLAADNCDSNIIAIKESLDKAIADGKTLVVYCNGFGCRDARTVAKHLSYAGYPVSIFSTGWKAWKNAELPVESASQTTPSSATSSAP